MSKVTFPQAKPNKKIASTRCPKCVKDNCVECTGNNCGCRKCGGLKQRRIT